MMKRGYCVSKAVTLILVLSFSCSALFAAQAKDVLSVAKAAESPEQSAETASANSETAGTGETILPVSEQSNIHVAIESGLPVAKAKPGQSITVRVPVVLEGGDADTILRQVTLSVVKPEDSSDWPFRTVPSTKRQMSDLSQGSRVDVYYEWQIDSKAVAGEYEISFLVEYDIDSLSQDIGSEKERRSDTLNLPVEVLEGGQASAGKGLFLLGKDEEGNDYPTPSAEAGDDLQIVLHIKNDGAEIKNVSIGPDMSSDIEQFPFEVGTEDAVVTISSLKEGAQTDATFSLKVKQEATSGQKNIRFTAVYREDGQAVEKKFTVPVEITGGEAPADTPQATAVAQSDPKIAIKDYTLTPSRPMAGEEFSLELELANEGDADAENLRISFSSLQSSQDGGIDIIIPVEESEDALFLDLLPAGEICQQTWKLRVDGDALNSAYVLTVGLEYENGKGRIFKNERPVNINVMRSVKVEMVALPRPEGTIVLDDVLEWEIELQNTGASTLSDLSLSINSDGLTLDNPPEIKDLKPGEIRVVNVSFQAQKEGDLTATLVLHYHGESGQTDTEELNLSLYVAKSAEEETPAQEQGELEEQSEKKRSALPLILIIGAVVVAAAYILWNRSKKQKS